MQPDGPVRTGAALALVVTALLPVLILGLGWKPGVGRFLDLLAGPLIALTIAGFVGLGVVVAVKVAGLLPRFVRWVGVGAIAALFLVVGTIASTMPAAIIVSVLGVIEAFFGGAIAVLVVRGFDGAPLGKKILVGVSLALGLAANVFVIYWFASRGTADHLTKVPDDPTVVSQLQAPDPSKAGSFKTLTLTYGSGADRRRADYGYRVAFKTASVDATPFVKETPGWRAWLRRWYWGFDLDHFPLNGRVWYPDGPGPFPLVLVVHGNHGMEEFSDPGYGYLGRHLATHGFIVVSVDENFFNGSWAGGLKAENDGRGWMLLQHLKAWKQWNETPKNPFAGKVDMANIALIGHSRGGEAAAIAGAFNRLRYYPDDGRVELPSGFAIKSIIAIAPSDGQYKPAGQPTPLENVNFLTLQGGHDADVSSFAGLRQYARVRFTDGQPHFKAAVYAYRANHGQFNTVWGDSDYGWPKGWVLNKKPLLSGAAQRRMARTYITAFLEATMLGSGDYVSLFRDNRAGKAWLPSDIYISRFEDSSFRPVATFEEDVDLTTASLSGATIEKRGLTLWKEGKLPYRGGKGSFENSVVYLGWDRNASAVRPVPKEAGRYTITLPADASPVAGVEGATGALVFSMAQIDESPTDEATEQQATPKKAGGKSPSAAPAPKPKAKKDEKPERADLTVELTDRSEHTARLPLSAFRRMPPLLTERFTKFWTESDNYGKSEAILQTFVLPLSTFAEAGFAAGFDPAALQKIAFVFDRTTKGVIVLDDVGLAGK
ncbi:MAG TPA: hypothetical protein VGK32_01225 [Vicinamibacterales bacterium]